MVVRHVGPDRMPVGEPRRRDDRMLDNLHVSTTISQ